jgi:acetylornithine deacetylase/succinyl-diaminopimelate desuccinylase-like protein
MTSSNSRLRLAIMAHIDVVPVIHAGWAAVLYRASRRADDQLPRTSSE